jgi:hypothetical protein
MCVAYNYITNGAVLHQRCNSRNLQCVHALRHKDMLLSRPVGQGMTFPWSGLLAHLDVAGQVWDYWPTLFTSRSASQAGRNDMKFGSRFLSAIGETKRKRWQNRFWLIYLLLLFRPEKVSLRRAQGVCPRTGDLPQSDWIPLPLCMHLSIYKLCVCGTSGKM